MSVSFNGINDLEATFKYTGTLTKGTAVKMSANGTVTACSSGDNFMGIAQYVSDGHAAVQLKGYIKMKYNGLTAPTVGYCTLTAGTSGAVQVDSDGREHLVIDVDTTNKIVGFMI